MLLRIHTLSSLLRGVVKSIENWLLGWDLLLLWFLRRLELGFGTLLGDLLLLLGNRDGLGQSSGDLLLDVVALLFRYIQKRVILLIFLQIETVFVHVLRGNYHECLHWFFRRLFSDLVGLVAILNWLWNMNTFAVVDLGVQLWLNFGLTRWVQSLARLLVYLFWHFLRLGCWYIALGWGFLVLMLVVRCGVSYFH